MVMTDIEEIEMPRVPVMASARVVAVGHAGHVHLLALETGQTLWTCALSAEKGASACDGQPVTVSIADEVVVAGSMGHVFAIRLDDGEILWHSEQRSRGAGLTNLAVGASSGEYVARLES